MAATPVEILGLKYPLCKDMINKISDKWQKRTKNKVTKWPKEGTFDVALCEEMETLIKNYKTKSLNKKREAKREKEKEVLAMFKKEGEYTLKSIKQARKILKEADRETCKKEMLFSQPPPYLLAEREFPILKDNIEVTGEMEMEGQVEIEPAVKTKSREQKKESENYLPMDCYKQARIALEIMKTNQEDKTRYEEVIERIKRKDCEIEGQVEALEQEMGKKIRESGKKIQEVNELERRRSKLFDSNEEMNGEEELFDTGKWEQGREKGTLRPLAAQLPILIKGAQGQYVPWASQDLEGLVKSSQVTFIYIALLQYRLCQST
ncbi:uncharacterized protein LOC131524952 [Onychostoma macrolepis]|uniref:uncharacterized protein LOC131524952 n=1 Tax=Onychostoma macrolepis TaxID=369639 RepID=UPI00272C6BE2|nr:uncharacterized protein LOC131524952 [Onychostoma macrolepis]XP_058608387.1 uncharacterized protein LOC131524952 [Onychostoma macrolepis]